MMGGEPGLEDALPCVPSVRGGGGPSDLENHLPERWVWLWSKSRSHREDPGVAARVFEGEMAYATIYMLIRDVKNNSMRRAQ